MSRLSSRGRALGDDRAVVDDHHAVAEGVCFLEVVRREEDGDAAVAQGAHVLPEVCAVLRVKAGGRLVEEQHLGLMDDPERHVQPASLPTRVRLDLTVGEAREVEQVEQLLRRARRRRRVRDRTGDLGASGSRGRSRGYRRRRADSRSRFPGGPSRFARDVETRRRVPAPSSMLSSVVSIRRVVVLPAPFGPRNPKISPWRDGKADAAHGVDCAVAGFETLAQLVRLDHVAHSEPR